MARYSPTLQFLAYCTARAARKLFRCCMGRVSPPALTYAQFVQAWSEPAVIGQGGLASRGHYLPADLEVEPSSVDTILNHVSQQKRSLRQHLQTASDTILEKIGLVSSATNQVLARLTEQSALIGQGLLAWSRSCFELKWLSRILLMILVKFKRLFKSSPEKLTPS